MAPSKIVRADCRLTVLIAHLPPREVTLREACHNGAEPQLVRCRTLEHLAPGINRSRM